jgi:hypothetical protein
MAITVRTATVWYTNIVSSVMLIISIATLFELKCRESNIITTIVSLIMGGLQLAPHWMCSTTCTEFGSRMQTPKGYLCKSLLYLTLGVGVAFVMFLDKSCWFVAVYSCLILLSGVAYGVTAYCEHLKLKESSKTSNYRAC